MKGNVMEYAEFADAAVERLRKRCGKTREVLLIKAGTDFSAVACLEKELAVLFGDQELFEGKRLRRDSLFFIPKDKTGRNTITLIALEDLYEEYQRNGMEEMERKLFLSLAWKPERGEWSSVMDELTNYRKIRNSLTLLPMTEKEADEKGYLHVTEMDIALAVAFIAGEQEGQIVAVVVPENISEIWGKSAEEAAADAFEVMHRRGPSQLAVFSPDEKDPWLFTKNAEESSLPPAGKRDIAVLRSHEGSCGICSLYYPGMLEKLSDMLGGDMVLLIDRSQFVFAGGSEMDAKELNRFRLEEFNSAGLAADSWYRYKAAGKSMVRGGSFDE